MKKELKIGTPKIIRMYGYEYHLVEVHRTPSLNVPDPCFMGYWNMALTKVVKIDKKRLQ